MASLPISPEEPDHEETSWATLDIYILLKILCRIPLNDLSWNVSFVCVSWQKACFELMFWNQSKLDLRIASPSCKRCNMFGARSGNLFDLGLGPGLSLPLEDAKMDAKLTHLLRGILEVGDDFGHDFVEWKASIYSVYVPCDLQLSDKHLVYVAERLPNVEVLVIEKATKITPGGFSLALGQWRHLEQIVLQLVRYDLYEEMLEVIMISRGHLSGVRLMTTAGTSPGATRPKYFGIW